MSILYRRTEVPGSISPAVPPGDLTEAQFRALRPDYRREVKASPLYERVDPGQVPTDAELLATLRAELEGMTRDELNQGAGVLGVPDPGKLKNKDDVIDAILDLGPTGNGGE